MANDPETSANDILITLDQFHVTPVEAMATVSAEDKLEAVNIDDAQESSTRTPQTSFLTKSLVLFRRFSLVVVVHSLNNNKICVIKHSL